MCPAGSVTENMGCMFQSTGADKHLAQAHLQVREIRDGSLCFLVESHQQHEIGALVATLSDAFCVRVSAGIGWPGVYIL